MINKFLIYSVTSPSGMVHGTGLNQNGAWSEAQNNYGLTKEGLIDEGFSIRTGVVLDYEKFKELIN